MQLAACYSKCWKSPSPLRHAWRLANTLLLMKMAVFWIIAPCSLVEFCLGCKQAPLKRTKTQKTVTFILAVVRTWNLLYYSFYTFLLLIDDAARFLFPLTSSVLSCRCKRLSRSKVSSVIWLTGRPQRSPDYLGCIRRPSNYLQCGWLLRHHLGLKEIMRSL
jgi:hypothetical protein